MTLRGLKNQNSAHVSVAPANLAESQSCEQHPKCHDMYFS